MISQISQSQIKKLTEKYPYKIEFKPALYDGPMMQNEKIVFFDKDNVAIKTVLLNRSKFTDSDLNRLFSIIDTFNND